MFKKAVSQRVPYQIRRGPVSYARHGIQANSFYQFAPLAWNALDSNVRKADTMDTFKNRLDKAWFDSPIRYDYTHLVQNINT